MKQKIKMIIEAFSMQPNAYYIIKANERKDGRFNDDDCIEILLQQKAIGSVATGEVMMVYTGINHKGDVLFEYLAKSVNVHYELPADTTKT